MTVCEMAHKAGLSERQLRRVVLKACGVNPVELLQSRRLLAAKLLLTDTRLSITEIAFASGFGSPRRLNALFQERYGINPTEMRRLRAASEDGFVVCKLAYRPPMDWTALLAFLSYRCIDGVEAVTEKSYRRLVTFGGASGVITAEDNHEQSCVVLQIPDALAKYTLEICARIRDLFDLDADPQIISGRLGTIAASSPGRRVPGCWDGFEVAVRAVCGQQISVKAATILTGKLAARFGVQQAPTVDDLRYHFPTPDAMAAADLESIITCGTIRTRAVTIQELAKQISDATLRLSPTADPERTIARLKTISGVGDWTAQYVCMRALRWPDAFPAADLVIMKRLKVTRQRDAEALAEEWRPWRAYAAMHLWQRKETDQ